MRLLAALLLSFSALSIGIMRARELKNTVQCLRELITLLELIKNEICTRRTPLGSILSQAGRMELGFVGAFVLCLTENLGAIGEKSFGELWTDCIGKTLGHLPQSVRSELAAVGGCIGRYDAELQAQSLDRCISVIKRELDIKTASLASGQRLSISLALSAGLIVSIILI